MDSGIYVKAEFVYCLIVKRSLRCSERSGPHPRDAIRKAYINAGVDRFNQAPSFEYHRTGTKAGGPQEVRGVGGVFAGSCPSDRVLDIGFFKSNVDHAERTAASKDSLSL